MPALISDLSTEGILRLHACACLLAGAAGQYNSVCSWASWAVQLPYRVGATGSRPACELTHRYAPPLVAALTSTRSSSWPWMASRSAPQPRSTPSSSTPGSAPRWLCARLRAASTPGPQPGFEPAWSRHALQLLGWLGAGPKAEALCKLGRKSLVPDCICQTHAAQQAVRCALSLWCPA